MGGRCMVWVTALGLTLLAIKTNAAGRQGHCRCKKMCRTDAWPCQQGCLCRSCPQLPSSQDHLCLRCGRNPASLSALVPETRAQGVTDRVQGVLGWHCLQDRPYFRE